MSSGYSDFFLTQRWSLLMIKSFLNISSRNNKFCGIFLYNPYPSFSPCHWLHFLWLNSSYPSWIFFFLTSNVSVRCLSSGVIITQNSRMLFSLIVTSSLTIPVMCFRKGWSQYLQFPYQNIASTQNNFRHRIAECLWPINSKEHRDIPCDWLSWEVLEEKS